MLLSFTGRSPGNAALLVGTPARSGAHCVRLFSLVAFPCLRPMKAVSDEPFATLRAAVPV